MNKRWIVKALFAVAIGIYTFTFSSIGQADEISNHKTPCSTDASKIVSKASTGARTALLKAIDTFKTPSPEDVGRQQKWFGALDSNSAKAVRQVYEQALGQLTFTQFWCPLVNNLTFSWEVGDVAAVHPAAPGQIFITLAFFQHGTSGSDSQLGTFVHELTHLAGVGLHPEEYGITKAKALAKANAEKARNNSDNYEYYVEDLLFGLP